MSFPQCEKTSLTPALVLKLPIQGETMLRRSKALLSAGSSEVRMHQLRKGANAFCGGYDSFPEADNQADSNSPQTTRAHIAFT